MQRMHKIARALILLACSGVLPASGFAQSEKTSKPDRWKTSAELSYTDQSGNKTLRLLTAGLKISHVEADSYKLETKLQSRYGESGGDVVARNMYGSLSFDLQPGRTWSPYLYSNAERDSFKRLDLSFSGGAGAKYTPYRAEHGAGDASLSLALLYSFENLLPNEADPHPPFKNFARWNLNLDASRDIGSVVTAQQTVLYQPVWGEMADYLLRSQTGLKVLLTKRLALSIQYNLERDARPPEGVEPDNRLLKTGLIIDF